MNIVSITWAVGFFFMCGVALWFNNDWTRITREMNNSWHELAKRQNEEWANKCLELIDKYKELEKKIEEMEHDQNK